MQEVKEQGKTEIFEAQETWAQVTSDACMRIGSSERIPFLSFALESEPRRRKISVELSMRGLRTSLTLAWLPTHLAPSLSFGHLAQRLSRAGLGRLFPWGHDRVAQALFSHVSQLISNQAQPRRARCFREGRRNSTREMDGETNARHPRTYPQGEGCTVALGCGIKAGPSSFTSMHHRCTLRFTCS